MGDFCMCLGSASMEPPNATPCSPAALKDPGTCCAGSGWPTTGNCICSAFLCYVNQGGGRDCFFQDLGSNGAEVPTTTATGAACCTWGDPSTGYICSCYDQTSAASCDGRTMVSECTISTVPPCSSDVTVGWSQVPTCQ
jgi:hypothetical protein